MAKRLRRETTMTLGWIAEQRAMGAAGYAANCLRAARKETKYAIVRDPFLTCWKSRQQPSRSRMDEAFRCECFARANRRRRSDEIAAINAALFV